MLFINTRPVERAQSLTQALTQHGMHVCALPLLELVPNMWDATLANLYAQFTEAQVVVVVSPSAVKFGMAHLMHTDLSVADLKQIRWIAVGQKTAEALAEFGLDSLVPEVETSEGMLHLPLLQNLALHSTIAFWRGKGGRQFMMDTLVQHGHHILNFVLYERRCPAQTLQRQTELIHCLAQYPNYVALISSEASWLNWLYLLDAQNAVLEKGQFWVLGERLEKLLQQYQQETHIQFKITVLKDLKTATIVQLLQDEQGKA